MVYFQKYDWNHSTSSLILSSFFWGTIITQIPAGHFARTGSAFKILSLSLFLSSVVNTLIPWLAEFGSTAVICARVLVGLGQGCLQPCTYALMSRWVPPLERARLGQTIGYQDFSSVNIHNFLNKTEVLFLT